MSAAEQPTGHLPTRPLRVDGETDPFWAATGEHRLVLPTCDRCGHKIWFPREFCPECSSVDVSWVEASGRGTVYSYTVTVSGSGPWKEVAPYVLAFVDLEEGPRVLTNIVGCEPTSVTVGMAVQVVWDDTGEGHAIYRFAPA